MKHGGLLSDFTYVEAFACLGQGVQPRMSRHLFSDYACFLT